MTGSKLFNNHLKCISLEGVVFGSVLLTVIKGMLMMMLQVVSCPVCEKGRICSSGPAFDYFPNSGPIFDYSPILGQLLVISLMQTNLILVVKNYRASAATTIFVNTGINITIEGCQYFEVQLGRVKSCQMSP